MLIMIWFWSAVGMQVLCVLHVLAVWFTKSHFPQKRWVQICWAYCIGALPPLWLALSSIAFVAEWKGERHKHWFYYVHDGEAGMVLVPFLLFTAVILSRALTNTRFRLRSRGTLIGLWISAAVCAWYVIAILFFKYVEAGDAGDSHPYWLFFPGVSGLNYMLIARMMQRESRARVGTYQLPAWLVSFVVALIAKFWVAIRFYRSLPDEKPQSCFVVSAAATGHPWLVRSWQHPELHKPVNRQWQRFKAFEESLRLRTPQLHARLRSVYNIIGPCIACGIRNPWTADFIYLALKPLELLVAICDLGED